MFGEKIMATLNFSVPDDVRREFNACLKMKTKAPS